MTTLDTIFLQAIAAFDSGNAATLIDIITKHSSLIQNRIQNNTDGYFKDPYFLWFIADNPIRTGKLPVNILEITSVLLQVIKTEAADTFQYQIDYALALVASGSIPRECGVQIAMIDLLIDAGASPDAAMAALTHGNLEAAKHLLDRGGVLNLTLAVCLERADDINRLADVAAPDDKITALAAAAFYGNEPTVKALLERHIDPNGFPPVDSGFHSHATPLHQAVSSGSLACIKLLVQAGARLDVRDKIYNGTPLEWASHLRGDADDQTNTAGFASIETYLRSVINYL